MRKLPAAAQEERRRQLVGLRQRGLTYREIAEQVGLSRTGVIDICQRFAAEGAKGLVSKPRGRKPDEQRLLDAAQEAEVQRLIRRHTPDERTRRGDHTPTELLTGRSRGWPALG